METEKTTFAPCGLDCDLCPAFADGISSRCAKELASFLSKQDPYFTKYIVLADVGKRRKREKEYDAFLRILTALSEPGCAGCRAGGDPKFCTPDCYVKKCADARAKLFCSDCDKFPCPEMDDYRNDPLYQTWLDRNLARRNEKTR